VVLGNRSAQVGHVLALHIASRSSCYRGKLYRLYKHIISYVRVSIIHRSNARANAGHLGRCTYFRPDLVESLLTTDADSTSCSACASARNHIPTMLCATQDRSTRSHIVRLSRLGWMVLHRRVGSLPMPRALYWNRSSHHRRLLFRFSGIPESMSYPSLAQHC
jgi:hypothetical protein